MREGITKEDLQVREREEFYPPRFNIFLAASQRDATLSDGKVLFKGATDNLKFDIYLDLPDTEKVTAPIVSSLPGRNMVHFKR